MGVRLKKRYVSLSSAGKEDGICQVGCGDVICLPREIFVHRDRSGPVGKGSAVVRRTRAFAVASEMSRGGVSMAVAAAFANSSATSLSGMPL